MALDRRIKGLENEYSISGFLNGSKLDAKILCTYLSRYFNELAKGLNFLENGARFYVDHNFHPEYATPESDTITEIVHAERAGDLLLTRVVRKAEEMENGLKIRLHKNNTDGNGNSWGCHENYMYDRGIKFEIFKKFLVPFFVTRQIYTGAGGIINGRYVVSPRSFHIVTEESLATTSDRGIINTRDEPHANKDKYGRMHVIVGDSDMLSWATDMKLGTTEIVFWLIENSYLGEDFLRKVQLKNPVQSIRDVSYDTTCTGQLELKNGGTITALGIQIEYAQAVLKYKSKLPGELQPYVDKWLDVLEDLAIHPRLTEGRVEWVTKYIWLEDFDRRHKVSLDSPKAQTFPMQWTDIDEERSLSAKIEASGHVEIITDRKIVERFVEEIHPSGRPKIRGSFIRTMREAGAAYVADWPRIQVAGYQPYDLSEPLNLNFPDIESYVRDKVPDLHYRNFKQRINA